MRSFCDGLNRSSFVQLSRGEPAAFTLSGWNGNCAHPWRRGTWQQRQEHTCTRPVSWRRTGRLVCLLLNVPSLFVFQFTATYWGLKALNQSASIDLFGSVAFSDQGFQQSGQPWWRIQLFVWEPVLFGTWDGVFTTCMINIFGVVLFLRTGYLVVSAHCHCYLPSFLRLFHLDFLAISGNGWIRWLQ